MADNAKHNEFVSQAVVTIGPGLIAQGSFSAQLVALESLIAGLFALIIRNAGKSAFQADGFLSALTHGVRGRLKKLLPDG